MTDKKDEKKKRFDKKLIIICLSGIGILISSVLLIRYFYLADLLELNNKYLAIEKQIKSLEKTVSDKDTILQEIQEKLEYFQKQIDYEKYKIPPIVSDLEELVVNGEPLGEFLETHSNEITFKTDLDEFSEIKVPTVQELQADFLNISKVTQEEKTDQKISFWQKYKEKIINKIKLGSFDNETELYTKSCAYIKDGKIKEAVEILDKIDQTNYNGLADFVRKAKLRVKLDEAFVKFKIKFSNSTQ